MNTDKPVRIGYNSDFAPFTFEENRKATGLIIEKIREISANAGLKVEFAAASLPELLPALALGEVDLLAALADTPARQIKYQFSLPLLVTGAGWFVPIDVKYKDGELPRSIITPKQGPLVDQIRNDYPDIEIHTSNDYDDTLQIVLYGNKKVQAAALNWHVGRMLVEAKYRGLFHLPERPFNRMSLAMAGLKNNKGSIIKELNNYIPNEWDKL